KVLKQKKLTVKNSLNAFLLVSFQENEIDVLNFFVLQVNVSDDDDVCGVDRGFASDRVIWNDFVCVSDGQNVNGDDVHVDPCFLNDDDAQMISNDFSFLSDGQNVNGDGGVRDLVNERVSGDVHDVVKLND